MPSPATTPSPARPVLPARRPSALPEEADPPADCAKSDEEAIDDVHAQVAATGSLEAAARRLAEMAGVSVGAAAAAVRNAADGAAGAGAGNEAGERARADATGGAAPRAVGGANGLAAVHAKRPVWMDDPEEAEYQAACGGGGGGGEDEDDVDMDGDEAEHDGRLAAARVEHLQEVVPGLWIGDLVAAMDDNGLAARGITNIVSLLRPSLAFSPALSVYALEIDDSPTTDILTHLPSLVAWIDEALACAFVTAPPAQRSIDIAAALAPTRPGAVLVHCQAGMSRSAAVVAAYLMRHHGLDPVQAVARVREARPVVDPSETFWHQLGLYYNADGKVTLRDRPTRQFYMERTTSQIMNGEGGRPHLDKLARFPATPTASNPATPVGVHGRRKIRCKMCRRHLAVREHMMDHILEQQPAHPPTRPGSRRGSAASSVAAAGAAGGGGGGGATDAGAGARRGSVVSDVVNPLTGLPGARSRQPSVSSPDDAAGASAGVPLPRAAPAGLAAISSSPAVLRPPGAPGAPGPLPSPGRQILDADALAARLPPHLAALRQAGGGSAALASPIASSPPSSPEDARARAAWPASSASAPAPAASSPGERGAPLAPSAAQVAGRKMSMLALTPTDGAGARDRRPSAGSPGPGAVSPGPIGGPPILVNPKCSGYFVEPLTWMEPTLASGAVAGKLVCPNEKCGAKIGNFDWAGVQCGCRDWVTPGFCIHRSKVDEVW